MRIGIDVRELRKDVYTGIGTFLRNFLKYIQEHYKGSDEFVLFGDENSSLSELSGGHIESVILPQKCSIVWDNIYLRQGLVQKKCDVFYSPYYKMPLFLKIPAVVTIHDYPLKFWLKNSYYFQIISSFPRAYYAARKARKVITVSQYSKQDISKYLRIDKRKITVVYECADSIYTKIPALRSEMRRKYSIPMEAFVLLYVGNLLPHKNVDTLLSAFDILAEKHRNLYLIIVTSANKLKFFKIFEKRDKKRIIILRDLNRQELLGTYNMSDLFITLSKYEGFGLPPLEAMACGLPAILSDAASLPEVGGTAAVYVKPDAMADVVKYVERFMQDEEFYKIRANLSTENAQRFSLETMGHSILAAIKGAVND